jgi:hypothetical protein
VVTHTRLFLYIDPMKNASSIDVLQATFYFAISSHGSALSLPVVAPFSSQPWVSILMWSRSSHILELAIVGLVVFVTSRVIRLTLAPLHFVCEDFAYYVATAPKTLL